MPAFLIEDREYKSLNGKIDLVITGCDLLAPAFFINKMGIRILAEWAEKNRIPIWIVGDSLRFIPGFNKKLSPNSLFEQVNYLPSMKILCEQGIIPWADFSRLF